MNDHRITTLEQLREILPTNDKHQKALEERLFDDIDEIAKGFIEDSPLVFLATANASGHVDVSPRGGEHGFVKVQDEKTLLLPEMRGNHDARNVRNILENNQMSLVFIIPRHLEVMRVTGRAYITNEPALIEQLVSYGRPPKLCIKIHVEECFTHCGRALNLSDLWRSDKWLNPAKRSYAKRRRRRGENSGPTYLDIGNGEMVKHREITCEAQLRGEDHRDELEKDGVDVYGNKIQKTD